MTGRSIANAPNGIGSGSGRTPWVVWTLMLLQCLGAANASFNIDTVRDIAYALDIVEGSKWHLSGPEIGFSFRLGPLWFYWLALPLALGLPLGLLAWFTAATSSLQYWFAWRLGVAVLDRSLGLCFALAIALPSWKQMYWLASTHTILTVPAILAALLAWATYWNKPSHGMALLGGLATSVALHGHPSALPLGSLLFLPLFRRASAGRCSAVLCAFAGCAVLFVPAIVEQALSGWTDVQRTARYLSGQDWRTNVVNAPWVAWNLVARGAPAGAEISLARHALLETAVTVATRLALVAGIVGLVGLRRSRRMGAMIGVAAVLAALNVLVVTAARDYVTYYSVDLAATLFALAIGAGWRGMLDLLQRRDARWLSRAGTASILLMTSLLVLGSTEQARAATVAAPIVAGLNLQRGAPLDATVVQPALFSRDLAALQRQVCAVPQPVVHGDGAVFLDLVGDVLGRATCNRPPPIQLGGRSRAASPDVAGVPCAIVSATARRGDLCWRPVARNLNAGGGLPAANSQIYLPHRYEAGMTPTTFEDTIGPDEILVLTITRPDWVQFAQPTMTIGGEETPPSYANGRTFAWKPKPGAIRTEPFAMTIATAMPEAVDIFTVSRETAPHVAPAAPR